MIGAGDCPAGSRPPAPEALALRAGGRLREAKSPAPPKWAQSWIGLPFDPEDRDPGCHCWGLVRRVLAAEKHLRLPAYAETSARELVAAASRFRRESDTRPWMRVGPSGRIAERDSDVPAQAYDVVLMSGVAEGKRAPIHCGILVSPRHVLHVEATTASVAVPLTHWSVAHRIIGFFRHEALS